MWTLNTLIDPASRWTLESANAINDSGWIVGYGTNAAGQNHASLLTPVPEPCMVILAAGGLMAVSPAVWRRKRNTSR